MQNADAIVFITQIIWMHFPALVKGWLERVFTYGFAYRLTEKGWKGDAEGRIPLLKLKKALIIQPAFFSEKVYHEKGFKTAMESIIDNWSLKYPGIPHVEHVYFHSILSATSQIRQNYLNHAIELGKNFGDGID